jgi:hypothetical protein
VADAERVLRARLVAELGEEERHVPAERLVVAQVDAPQRGLQLRQVAHRRPVAVSASIARVSPRFETPFGAVSPTRIVSLPWPVAWSAWAPASTIAR